MNDISWLNQAFFEKALQNYHHDPNLSIRSLSIKHVSEAADHFCSVLYRVRLTFDSPVLRKFGKRSTFIVKTAHFSERIQQEAFKDSRIFEFEARMYEVVLPELERLLQIRIAPTRIFCTMEPYPCLVLKDLTRYNMRVPERPLDFEGAVRMAQILGHFHAASMKIHSSGAANLEQLFNGHFFNPGADEVSFYAQFSVPLMNLILDEVRRWKGFECHAAKLKVLIDSVLVNPRSLLRDRERNSYNVLNHGDFHYMNILTNYYADGRIKDVALIDFQLCYWTTPAYDVINFLYMMISAETRDNYREELVRLYYETFRETLEKLDFDGRIPTLLDLNLELLKNGIQEVAIGITYILYLFMDLKNSQTEEIFLENVDRFESFKAVVKSVEYQVFLKKELDKWLHQGVLDVM